MSLLFLTLGVALPTISGWLLLRAIEGTIPVLSHLERWAAGFIIGLTGTMYVTFLAHILGFIRLDFWGFLAVQITFASLLAASNLLRQRRHRRSEPFCSSADQHSEKPVCTERRPTRFGFVGQASAARFLLCVLLIWTSIKIIAASATFLLTPLYVDDAIDNWNMRGKLIFHHQELVLGFPGDPQPTDGGTYAYPPTVSMTKAWLAILADSWSEPLVNSIHIVWYLALLALLFGTVRATIGLWFGLLGLYIFGSLPLPLLHATNPYADMFLAAHIGAAACFLLRALRSPDSGSSLRFLLLASLPIALLPFTKNEGLVLYLPALALALALAIFSLARQSILHRRDVIRASLFMLVITSSVLLPWLFFKWMHGFSFGNAKGLPNILEFSWNPMSLRAIVSNTIFEGNWLLLFPLFASLLLWQWRRAFTFPLLPLSVSFLLAYVLQIALFTFTPLATEAIKQTGYARGVIHLIPLVILLTVLLLHETLQNPRRDPHDPLYSTPCLPTPRSSGISRK